MGFWDCLRADIDMSDGCRVMRLLASHFAHETDRFLADHGNMPEIWHSLKNCRYKVGVSITTKVFQCSSA